MNSAPLSPAWTSTRKAALYRIFDISIASELALPGLVGCADKIPDWTITLPQGGLNEDGYLWFHTWKAVDGQEIMSCARRGENYLLDIMGLAKFVIYFDEHRIEAYPQAACTENTLAHLLQDQVIPRVICHGGRLVMHASAVELTDGRTVAFTGPSGWGKSTLASAFYQSGHRLLTDDCLLLENRAGVVSVVPAYPSLRLWPDSASELAAGLSNSKGEYQRDAAQFSEMAHYTHKKQLLFEPVEKPENPDWSKISALFVLGESPGPDDDENVRTEPLSGNLTVMAIIEALFALDVVNKKAVTRNFEAVSRVAGGMPVFRLIYPRHYEILPKVLDLVARGNPVLL
jgi:hypothetical protein